MQTRPVLSASNAEGIEGRKDSKQFVRKGARILREWYSQHQEYPYPSDEQKDVLSRETSFSKKRISTWFANARRRHKQKIQPLSVPPGGRAGSPVPTGWFSSMTPMERWQASPPEDGVPEAKIKESVASADDDVEPAYLKSPTVDPWDLEGASSHLGSSASSFGSRASEESSESASSAWSYQSASERSPPFPLLPRVSRTRRRRQRPRHIGEPNPYQCTFCTASFRKRHDWYRHEKSVHLPLESWICTPDLTQLQDMNPPQTPECRYCDAPFPAAAHWEEHEFPICAAKPVPERSFARKDHLWQHLRKFHGCTKFSALDLDAWRSTSDTVSSRCGFCGMAFSSWTTRAQHLAEEHFKKGARMDGWTGDWGLDAATMGVLRNAILPGERERGDRSMSEQVV